MSNRNELDPNKVKVVPLSKTAISPQQLSIKAWSQKLLVALLCVASFYGGWKSHESRMVNQCFVSGGQIIEAEKTLLCKVL